MFIRRQKRKHLTTVNLDKAVLLAQESSAEERRYAHAVLKDYSGTESDVYALVCNTQVIDNRIALDIKPDTVVFIRT